MCNDACDSQSLNDKMKMRIIKRCSKGILEYPQLSVDQIKKLKLFEMW